MAGDAKMTEAEFTYATLRSLHETESINEKINAEGILSSTTNRFFRFSKFHKRLKKK
jgi:hypothetical protein